MFGQLYLEEGKITHVSDGFGYHEKNIQVEEGNKGVNLNLREDDVALLSTILGCSATEFVGKSITVVGDGHTVCAVGYQGLYIPLKVAGSSKIMPESELCELLGCSDISRLDINGKEIATYKVPIMSNSNRMQY